MARTVQGIHQKQGEMGGINFIQGYGTLYNKDTILLTDVSFYRLT
jgi:hypothetical protein